MAEERGERLLIILTALRPKRKISYLIIYLALLPKSGEVESPQQQKALED